MKSLLIPEDDTEKTYYVVPVVAIIQKCRTVLILILLYVMVTENTNSALFTMEEKTKKRVKICDFLSKNYLSGPLKSPSNQTSHFSNTKKSI